MYLYKRIPRNWSYFHFVMQVNWGLQRIRNLPKFSGLLRGKRKTKTQVFMTQALDHLNIHSIASPGYTFGYLECLNRRSKYLNKSSILIFRLLPFNYGISRLSHPGNWYFLICLPGGPLKWRSISYHTCRWSPGSRACAFLPKDYLHELKRDHEKSYSPSSRANCRGHGISPPCLWWLLSVRSSC